VAQAVVVSPTKAQYPKATENVKRTSGSSANMAKSGKDQINNKSKQGGLMTREPIESAMYSEVNKTAE